MDGGAERTGMYSQRVLGEAPHPLVGPRLAPQGFGKTSRAPSHQMMVQYSG